MVEPVAVICRNTHYGCCPDGETAANGPSAMGCPGENLSSLSEIEIRFVRNIHHFSNIFIMLNNTIFYA